MLRERSVGDLPAACLLHDLVPEQTKARILANADLDEMAVLFRNPEIGDEALADLYRKAGPFEKLNDDRWLWLVKLAAENPRIVAAGDEEHGPDWGFWDIHKALFELVTKAPVTDEWCRALHSTFAAVHPPSVAIEAPITETLRKWEAFEAKDYKGQTAEDTVANSVSRLEQRLVSLAKDVRNLWWLMVVGFIALAWVVQR